VTSRCYLFVFESEANAKIFIQRLVLNLKHIAVMREGVAVHVLDGADLDQREEILRLAKFSNARHAAM
jgi:hypothetical protein